MYDFSEKSIFILFMVHVFYRMLQKRGDKLRKPFFSRFPKKSECRLSKILKIFFGERNGVVVT
ncbi:MAG: hypothetical protein A2007_03745 [Verrucomicrobia bacterium GWC2_42_7]|nr:MAG: hypothetical protein A2007_03745 [Verrucomicrobia bacterium GWC2_42_7]